MSAETQTTQGAPKVQHAIQTLLDEIHRLSLKRVDELLAEETMQAAMSGEEVLSEEVILKKIDAYLAIHKDKYQDFIDGDGKVVVILNSAQKFADYVIQKLGIDSQRVSRVKVSTYKGGVSEEKDIDLVTKQELLGQMRLQTGDKVLILEDMIDTGNVTQRLFDFFESLLSRCTNALPVG